VSLNDQTFLPP